MTGQKTTRKLRAILSADVKGYSLLMADDEVFTIQTIKEYRNIISSCVEQHTGRVVDSPGDNILADFASAVDAVQCAVEIQKQLKKENDRLVEEKRLEFRIGINIGDVVHDGDRIYGDGVNIAARIEGLADPGGVCISRSAYDQIKKKVGFEYAYLGEQPVKNIDEPVRIYKVLMAPVDQEKPIVEEKKPSKTKWIAAAAAAAVVIIIVVIWQLNEKKTVIPKEKVVQQTAPVSIEKPSIAVLPFDNLSDDPEQEFFSDGITEEIITGLSKVPDLFVISRNSVLVYKGKPINVGQVGKELHVRYVLEGSVRKAENRVRITAQLIDTTTGGHVWSERYDRKLTDIFALQDDITKNIMSALQIKLTVGEEARFAAKGTDNLNAYIKFLHGRNLVYNFNKEDNARGRQVLNEVIAMDPNFASAYAILSGSYFLDIIFGTSKSPKESVLTAIKFSKKAIELDDTLSGAYALLGFLYVNIGKYDEGIALCKRGVELGPSDESAYRHLSLALRWAGRWDEAIKASQMAIRLNPFPQSATLYGLGLAYAFTGQFEKAIEACKRATFESPNDLLSHVSLAAVYGMANRIEEAVAISEDVLNIEPNFSGEQFLKRLKWKNKEDIEHFLKALQKAGL